MEVITLVDELLLEQRTLTAVDVFARRRKSDVPEGRRYRDLVPLTSPGPGEQYAFEVNLAACTGCKACVSACHHLNGLDEEESWRDVGLLWGQGQGENRGRQQVVTTACHHCAEPACADGCPTLAYEKDAVTGVVRHLDDQCMGCRYCEMKCPYQVPKYNDRLGIVRKCDMCQGRLAAGEAPACVQACPAEAIRIRTVPIPTPGEEEVLLPGTVRSTYTRPATQFLNLDQAVSWRPANGGGLGTAEAHWPLAVMLVLVPAAVGIVSLHWLADVGGWGGETGGRLWLAGALGYAGLGCSVLHLGRPSQAWRAVLGWRRSWLSREILAFNLWAGSLALYACGWLVPVSEAGLVMLGGWATATGGAGLLASVMVYADTKRPFWEWRRTATRFFGTAMGAGAVVSPIPWLALLPLAAVLTLEIGTMWGRPALGKPGWLMRGPLRRMASLRGFSALGFAAAVMGGAPVWVMLALWLGTEGVSRALFFQAVEEPGMPGGAA